MNPSTREPVVLYAGLIPPIVAVIAAFVFKATPDAQTWVNAVAVALSGMIAAAFIDVDHFLPALSGFVQAVLLLAVGFGADLDAGTQALILTAVAAVAATIVRKNVTPTAPPVSLAAKRAEKRSAWGDDTAAA